MEPQLFTPDELKAKVNDIRNFFDPTLRNAYLNTVFTRRPIPDFLLTFGDKNNINTVRTLRAKYLSKIQVIPQESSLRDTVFATFYLMATMTLKTVLHMSVDPRYAWTRYRQRQLPPFVVIDYAPNAHFDSIEETRAHLKSGNGMKVIPMSMTSAFDFANLLVTSNIHQGVFLSYDMKNRIGRPRSSPLSRLPVYTNLISPDNFVGIYRTKTLKYFPLSASNDVATLTTLIAVTDASIEVLTALHGKSNDIPSTWLISANSARLHVIAFEQPPNGRENLIEWINSGQTTILSGTTPETIPQTILEAGRIDIHNRSDLAPPNTLMKKITNMISNISTSRCLVIIGRKAAGKSSFLNTLPDTIAIMDSDDFGSSLSISLEAAMSALIAITSSHRTSPLTAQAMLGTLMEGEEVNFRPPLSVNDSLKLTMNLVHRKYVDFDHLPDELKSKETNMIYNVARAMLTDGFALDCSYMSFVSRLKQENRPIVIFVHTDSEAVAIRATLRRGTVTGVSSAILPSDDFITNRQRDFMPFQLGIMAMYSKDIVADYMSFDSIRRCIRTAWDK